MEQQALDGAVIAALPPKSTVVSVVPHGKTRWSIGLRVDVEVEGEEEEQQFFVKLISREEWFDMAEAEYEGEKALVTYIPDNVVAPLAWGPLQDNPKKSFFMTRFRNLRARSPPVIPLLAILKRLHQTSISPTGKFGFHVTTFLGPPPMINDWTDNWEEYYSRQWRADLIQVQKVHGRDAELQALGEEFCEKVIARLLRPLQTGGRTIKPSLCHGDLWDGNVQIDVDTQEPIIFDAVCFYGHNEVDLQCMGNPRYALGMDFVDMYKDQVGASEPQEDFYDRHKLYALRADLITAVVYPQWGELVDKCKEEMRDFLKKYPNGYAHFVDEEMARAAEKMEKPEVDLKTKSDAVMELSIGSATAHEAEVALSVQQAGTAESLSEPTIETSVDNAVSNATVGVESVSSSQQEGKTEPNVEDPSQAHLDSNVFTSIGEAGPVPSSRHESTPELHAETTAAASVDNTAKAESGQQHTYPSTGIDDGIHPAEGCSDGEASGEELLIEDVNRLKLLES